MKFFLAGIGVALVAFAATNALAAPQTCPGDANGDNHVDILDLSYTASHLHMGTAPYQYGDVNGDMIVTQADLDLEAANYGRQCVVVPGLAADQ